jgi:LysR family transcriptional regulator (chromosome initiation inhibitor)
MIRDLQWLPELVVLDPRGNVDIQLYSQQWKLHSPALEQVATAVRAAAAMQLG